MSSASSPSAWRTSPLGHHSSASTRRGGAFRFEERARGPSAKPSSARSPQPRACSPGSSSASSASSATPAAAVRKLQVKPSIEAVCVVLRRLGVVGVSAEVLRQCKFDSNEPRVVLDMVRVCHDVCVLWCAWSDASGAAVDDAALADAMRRLGNDTARVDREAERLCFLAVFLRDKGCPVHVDAEAPSSRALLISLGWVLAQAEVSAFDRFRALVERDWCRCDCSVSLPPVPCHSRCSTSAGAGLVPWCDLSFLDGAMSRRAWMHAHKTALQQTERLSRRARRSSSAGSVTGRANQVLQLYGKLNQAVEKLLQLQQSRCALSCQLEVAQQAQARPGKTLSAWEVLRQHSQVQQQLRRRRGKNQELVQQPLPHGFDPSSLVGEWISDARVYVELGKHERIWWVWMDSVLKLAERDHEVEEEEEEEGEEEEEDGGGGGGGGGGRESPAWGKDGDEDDRAEWVLASAADIDGRHRRAPPLSLSVMLQTPVGTAGLLGAAAFASGAEITSSRVLLASHLCPQSEQLLAAYVSERTDAVQQLREEGQAAADDIVAQLASRGFGSVKL